MTDIHLTAVKSSNIRRVGYDGTDLYVQFRSGQWYCYIGVPLQVAFDIVSAESPGRYFSTHIKEVYDCQKIEAPEAVGLPPQGSSSTGDDDEQEAVG